MGFLDENYLLGNKMAKDLYLYVKDLPIIDVHNHGDIVEVIEDKGWEDIWQVEAETDHYVWELMRRRGIPEEKITGKASNKEKWLALAEVFPDFVGNPTYEWVHLDLKRRFGIDKLISANTAEYIWEKTKVELNKASMKPQQLLKEMNVEIMCTTNNPDEDLKYHSRAREEVDGVSIRPTWRPDKALNIEKDSWTNFVRNLGNKMGVETGDLNGFLTALQKSHDKFEELGCVASDHGVQEPVSYFVERKKANKVYKKALAGEDLSARDIKDFKAFMLIKFGEMNQASNWVTQLHIGAVRDYRDQLHINLGPDSGGDVATSDIKVVENLRYFFNQFDKKLKIVLYCLDYSILPALTTIARAFPNVNLGAPWWFNDSPYGMEKQLKYIATVDLMKNHAGMVTDSRKLMSYDSRTEMFRRVLSSVLGEMVEKGQMPKKIAYDLAETISYHRPLNLFFNDNE